MHSPKTSNSGVENKGYGLVSIYATAHYTGLLPQQTRHPRHAPPP